MLWSPFTLKTQPLFASPHPPTPSLPPHSLPSSSIYVFPLLKSTPPDNLPSISSPTNNFHTSHSLDNYYSYCAHMHIPHNNHCTKDIRVFHLLHNIQLDNQPHTPNSPGGSFHTSHSPDNYYSYFLHTHIPHSINYRESTQSHSNNNPDSTQYHKCYQSAHNHSHIVSRKYWCCQCTVGMPDGMIQQAPKIIRWLPMSYLTH